MIKGVVSVGFGKLGTVLLEQESELLQINIPMCCRYLDNST